YAILARLPVSQTTYSDLNLPTGSYMYTVSATDAAGDSTPAGPVTAAIPAIPVTPSLGHGAAASTHEIDIGWQDNSNNEDGFQILRRTGTTGVYTLIATLPANTTTF